MPDLATRLRTIRDGLHAGCSVDELTADLEAALADVETWWVLGDDPDEVASPTPE